MARYQQNFTLDPVDIDLIEHALRGAIARHTSDGLAGTLGELERTEISALNRVLGKIHNQKIFYAQVKVLDVPAA